MFSTQGLFAKVICPDYPDCALSPCLFSHRPPPTSAPPKPSTAPPRVSSAVTSAAVPAKRAAPIENSHALSRKQVRTDFKPAVRSSVAHAPPAPAKAPPSILSTPVPAKTFTGTTFGKTSNDSSLTAQVPAPRVDIVRGTSHTPTSDRQKMLTTLFAQFVDNYANLDDPLRARQLASQHAKLQEAAVFARTNKMTYKNGMISTMASLKKRPKPTSEDETGTLEDDARRAKELAEKRKGKLSVERIRRYVHDKAVLAKYDYVVDVPDGPGGDAPTEEGNKRACQRCAREFVVKSDMAEEELTACSYHFGRMITDKTHGVKRRVYSCCPAPEAPPCSTGPHVFQDKDRAVLHSRVPFKETRSLESVSSGKSASLPVVALDCEMVYTTSGMSLARVTAVNDEGDIVFDEHVRPQGTVLDLNTRYSGVKPEDLQPSKAVFDLDGAREALGMLISDKTILVGHALENDLTALRLVHSRVIDTAILYPHVNGPPWRYALRILTRDHLGKFIQDSDSSLGHSALEDSRAALELVRHKMKQDLA